MDLQKIAEHALEGMTAAGFDAAQISVSVAEQDELNITHNDPSLLRSTEDYSLSLMGILDQRKASMTLTDLSPAIIDANIGDLVERAKMAPQDEANAVSKNQQGRFVQGPVEADLNLLAEKVQELLDFRADKTPKMSIDEGAVLHRVAREVLLTSEGTNLASEIGSYSISVEGTASEGDKVSSYNYIGGVTNDLTQAHASKLFGIGNMLAETERQIETRPTGGNFAGDVILAPTAVGDLLDWLLGQLRDYALISDSSLYKNNVGQQIASDKLTIRSRFDGPGHAAYTNDGYIAEPLTLIEKGELRHLLPGLYASRKTGIKHVPASSGWTIDTGETSKQDLIAGVNKGAMVTRLSMGSPGPNGDFSGIIKNSFVIENGEIGQALSEAMISGNMANMLNNIVGISSEHLDLGATDFPWVRISGLNFS